MPNLWGYARDLFQTPGFGDEVDFDQIKQHYYVVHTDINPTEIVPAGPDESGWRTPARAGMSDGFRSISPAGSPAVRPSGRPGDRGLPTVGTQSPMGWTARGGRPRAARQGNELWDLHARAVGARPVSAARPLAPPYAGLLLALPAIVLQSAAASPRVPLRSGAAPEIRTPSPRRTTSTTRGRSSTRSTATASTSPRGAAPPWNYAVGVIALGPPSRSGSRSRVHVGLTNGTRERRP